MQWDIKTYIGEGIHDSGHLNTNAELKESVTEALQVKSEGIFLFVKLMVDDLRKSESTESSSLALEDLSCGLEKAYRLLFTRLLDPA